MAEKHWIKSAIRHPGALTRKAHAASESPHQFAEAHKHSSGATGKQARLALTLGRMHNAKKQLKKG